MEKWIQPLYERFTDQIEICGIAELSAVPAFARGIAQGIISGLVKYPVLLDWEGSVSRSYQVEKAQTTLVIIDTHGKIRMRKSGDFNAEKFTDISALITSLLPEQS